MVQPLACARDWTAMVLLLLSVNVAADWEDDAPARVILDVGQALVTALHTNQDDLSRNPRLAQVLVRDLLDPLMDYTAISRRLAGSHWRRGTVAQRDRLLMHVRNYLQQLISRALVQHTQQVREVAGTLRIIRQRVAANGRLASVATALTLAHGLRVDVNFVMRRDRRSSIWKLVDIQLEGLSLLAVQGRRLAAYLQKGGLDGLSDHLARQSGSKPCFAGHGVSTLPATH